MEILKVRYRYNKKFLLDIFRRTVLWIVLFMYFFDSWMVYSTRNIAIMIAIGACLFKYRSLQKSIMDIGYQNILFFVVTCLVWDAGILIREPLVGQLQSASYLTWKEPFHLITRILVMATFCVIYFKDEIEFCKVIVSMLILNSLIAIGSCFIQPVKDILNLYYSLKNVEQGEYIAIWLRTAYRGVGFELIGSAGSIILLLGQIILLHLMDKHKIRTDYFIISYSILSLGQIAVGRTGLYLGIIIIFVYFVLSILRRRQSKLLIKFLAAFVIIMFAAMWVLQNYSVSVAIYNRILEFCGKYVEGGKTVNTIAILANMNIPDLMLSEFLFGTSIVGGISYYGTVIHNDIGYIQSYSAFGIIGVLAFYMGFLILMLSPLLTARIKEKPFFMFLIALTFLLECKEPVIRESYVPFIVVALELFVMKEKRAAIKEHGK